ncbi:hypothetical protein CPB85DRAFT_230169 [Mucidula mucida]|nr:hypothetical protein CPB85DRAFT_230169 [Mucidula mucida]
MVDDQSLEALANLLNLISENPFDLSLHVQHIRLAQSLPGMDAEVQSAMEMLTSFYAANEDVWTHLIKLKKDSADLNTEEGVNEVLALYEQAENDYLSIPILKSHVEFLLDGYNKYSGGEEAKPDDLGEMFTAKWMRATLPVVTKKSTLHWTRSHEVWDLQRDWAMEQLEGSSGPEKADLVDWITEMLVERLKQPHSNSDDTSVTYSSFTTANKPEADYMKLLQNASQDKSRAVKAFDRRFAMENTLKQSGFSLEAYSNYISWESRSKFPDLFAITGLHERAIAEAAKVRFEGQAGAETYLRAFWTSYSDARAVRSVPSSGESWARYIRLLERSPGDDTADSIAGLYDTALITTVEVEQLIPLVLARAGFEKRLLETGDGDADSFATLLEVMETGMRAVRKDATGDQWFRLEKYLAEIYRSAGLTDNVIGVWEAATKHYKNSYSAWTQYTDALMKGERSEEARKVFQDNHRKNFDWPEGVWDAWIAFEHLYGTLTEVNAAIDAVEQARSQLNARRAKEAAKTQYQYDQASAEQLASAVLVADVPIPHSDAMNVDQQATAIAERGTKRRADDADDEDSASKRQKIKNDEPLKRDRENCTVFVADMPRNVSEGDLRALFKDCGKIREVRITAFQAGFVATVEFMDRDSVPQALTKDKKRIHNQEIAVHLAWSSTLYVTNFPEHADDSYIRNMFNKYGVIFDVRWPSKKFKNSRRFCYVQYTSPASAQQALELHEKELEAGFPLSVLISNPERKKGRTDQDADQREIHVAGLPRTTTSDDLRKIFKEYGTVQDVRLGTDKDGRCKGFAFVEFETPESASSALQANNSEFKTRRLAVTMSDPRAKRARNAPDTGFGERADTRNRSVRIKNLPPNTESQEGLLQQALEKIAKVKRVEIIGDTCEALVEMINAAEAGKLLLNTEPLLFGGNTLKVLEETALPGPVASSSRETKFVPRAAASKPRAGLGQKKRLGIGASSSAGSKAGAGGKGQNDFRSMLG